MRIKDTQCIISLASLKNGEHSFLFTIDGELFQENHFEDIHEADLKAIITFNKNSPILMFNFTVEGTVTVTCDRCGDDFKMPTKIERQLVVKTECKTHQEEDDMVSLATGEKDIDIAPFVYQFVVLSLPMQRIHANDKNGKSECNSEIINKLKRLEVKKSNEEKYITNGNMRSSHTEKPTNN
ncbi:MAG: YceD family protein [Bacteroidia bacterium]